MKKVNLKDNLQYENATEGVIFNHYSFCELIKYIMVAYGHITYNEANQKLHDSFLIEPPKSMDEVELLGHELEYHWAMLTLHGDMYWTKGIPSDFNSFKKEYLNWEAETKRKYNLKESYKYYEKNQ